MAEEKKPQPTTFLKIIESPDGKFQKGTFLPIEFTKDGVAKVIGKPVLNPKVKD